MNGKLGLVVIALAFALSPTSVATAQIVVTASATSNVRTSPGFIDLDDAAVRPHSGVGLSLALVTEGWVGVEGEAALTPSAFSRGDLIDSGRLIIASASVLALAPARWNWPIRPFFSIGAGIAEINSVDVAELFVINSTHPVATAGLGAWWWIRPSLGVRTGIRFVRTLNSVDTDSLEMWQPSVGFSVKF